MNWLDFVLLAAIALGAIAGFHKGFVRTAIGAGAALGGIVAALWLYRSTGFLLRPFFASKQTANLVGLLAVFLAFAVLGAIAEHYWKRLHQPPPVVWADRGLGVGLGLLKGTLDVAVLTLLLALIVPPRLEQPMSESRLVSFFARTSVAVIRSMPDQIRDGFRAAIRDMEAKPLPPPFKNVLARME